VADVDVADMGVFGVESASLGTRFERTRMLDLVLVGDVLRSIADEGRAGGGGGGVEVSLGGKLPAAA